MNIKEHVSWKSQWTITKFRDPQGKIATILQQGIPIDDMKRYAGELFIAQEVFPGNVALNEGLQNLIDVACGLGGTAYGTASYIGVGSGTTAAVATDGSLVGTATAHGTLDSGYPTRTSQTVTWRVTFGTGDANFPWEEYTVVNYTDDTGQNLNRKVESKGTKAAGETWSLNLAITFS